MKSAVFLLLQRSACQTQRINRGEQAYNINNPHQNHVAFLYVNVAFNVNVLLSRSCPLICHEKITRIKTQTSEMGERMICFDCQEAMSEIMSEETRRTWDRFREENFPGIPSDFEPFPSRPAPVSQ